MEESCQPESLSSYRNVSEVAYYVRNKVELCIQNYMSLEVTAKYLEKNHKISKSVTQIVWEQLREENPVFFNHFEIRCQMAIQMRMFKDMLTKQAVGMFENGLLDICDASPSVKALLRQQHPERVHLLETLASKTKLSSASLVFPYANGPSVAQTQIPYNQQDQVLNPASFAMPNPNGPIFVQSQNPYDQQEQVIIPASFTMPNPNGSSASAAQWQIPNEHLNQHLYPSSLAFSDANVTQLPIPYDQQDQHLHTTNLPLPYANGTSVTQLPIPYDQQEQQDQHLFTTNLPLSYANGQSVTQLPIPNNQQNQPHQNPLPTYNNDLISPTFAPADTDDWLQLIDPAAFADLGVLPPLPQADTTTNPWSSSDYTSWTDAMPEDFSIFEFGGDIMSARMLESSVQQNGEEMLCNNNFDITPPMQTYTSLHQQQAGGVNNHHLESEALNNPESAGVIGHNGPSDSYIKTAAQLVMQPSEQPRDLNGHYQPQQNVSVETVQRGGRSNGVVNGESSDHQHSKRVCTSVDQQQAGRVKRHHPESEALNNPTSGKSNAMSLKEWEHYESQETKEN